MKRRIHIMAGVLGTLVIASFWLSTIVSELFSDAQTIAWVKGMVLKGMFILVPAMIIVGASGMNMGAKRKDAPARAKKKRMPFIAANGLLVLVPAAFFLQAKASARAFDTMFFIVQGIELLAGAINLSLMSLNIRDGRTMAARRRGT